MNTIPIKVAIADDHRVVRQAMQEVLSHYHYIKVLYGAEDGEELLSKLSLEEPDVILLDLKMPRMNGLQVLEKLHERNGSVRVLVLTAYLDEIYVAECLKFGINGFLTKDMNIAEIVRAIEAAHKNEVYFTNLLSNAWLRKYLVLNRKKCPEILPVFSDEEIRIVELIKTEKTTDEIADMMCMSKRSIELKRERMKEKANAKTTIGLLLYCMKRGLIE